MCHTILFHILYYHIITKNDFFLNLKHIYSSLDNIIFFMCLIDLIVLQFHAQILQNDLK